MKYFIANCFQALNGRYLTLEEHNKSSVKIIAEDEEDAFCKLAEREQEDSELKVEERWNVYETTKANFDNCQLPI